MGKVTTIALLLCATAVSQEVPDDVAGHIMQLAATETKEVRLRAITSLRQAAKKGGLHALPTLLASLKDQDAEIRAEVVQAVGAIAFGNNLPCPSELIHAFFDSSDDVRHHACTYAGATWKKYPRDILPLLFKAMKHKD